MYQDLEKGLQKDKKVNINLKFQINASILNGFALSSLAI